MSFVFNEQTRLLATALNTAATSCFTVGIATPLAGYVYNISNLQTTLTVWTLLLGVGISNLQTTLTVWTLLLGVGGWLLAATLLHLLARRVLMGLKP